MGSMENNVKRGTGQGAPPSERVCILSLTLKEVYDRWVAEGRPRRDAALEAR